MIWAIIPGPVKRFMAWVLAGLAVLWAAWVAGRREARQKAALEAARDHIKTTERMHNAADDLPDDDLRLREWLRSRSKR